MLCWIRSSCPDRPHQADVVSRERGYWGLGRGGKKGVTETKGEKREDESEAQEGLPFI